LASKTSKMAAFKFSAKYSLKKNVLP